VLGALNHAHARLSFLVERAQREGHHAEALLGHAEEFTRCLHLQLVDEVLLLVDGGAGVVLFWLAFAGAHQHVQCVDFVHVELTLVAALFPYLVLEVRFYIETQ